MSQDNTFPSILGVSLAVVGSSLIGISYTASKTAHNQVLKNSIQAESDNDRQQQEFSVADITKYPVWWIGIILLLCGEAFNFSAYAYAPTSVVAPLGTLSIISGAVSGSLYLGEAISKRNLFGMLVSVCGACIIVAFSRAEEPQLSPDDIIKAISQVQFIIYISTSVLFAILLQVLDNWQSSPDYPALGERFMMIRVSLTATFSGFTVLATKSLSSLLGLSLYHIFGFWITYILLFVMIANALLTLFYTNKALSSFDSTQVLPAEFAAFTLTAVLGSSILYNDFESATLMEIGMFIIGCFVVFAGVYLITSGQDKYGKNIQVLSGRESIVIMAGSFLPVTAVQSDHPRYSRLTTSSDRSATRPLTHPIFTYGTAEPTIQVRRTSVAYDRFSRHNVADFINALATGNSNLGGMTFQQVVNDRQPRSTSTEIVKYEDSESNDVASPLTPPLAPPRLESQHVVVNISGNDDVEQEKRLRGIHDVVRGRALTRAQTEQAEVLQADEEASYETKRQRIKSFFRKVRFTPFAKQESDNGSEQN